MATDLRRLDRTECLALLASHEVGRVAVLDGGTPTILPINYALDGEAVVFRTDPGLKLSAGPRAPASFEVDDIDPVTRSGWSVIVAGRLEEVTAFDHRTWERIRSLPVGPWADGPKAHWMRLVPVRISGRATGPARPI
jgi:nitroimidazol reductase NimA-like FMN-containing flavoprotein (pyridoxamine 5'-phosphate oxidase superfamily)